jgi:hypothetical protein
MATFVTLCEAYMGIEPHFNLWNYFFPRLATAGLSRGSSDVGQCGHQCPIQDRSRYLFSYCDTQPSSLVVESLVLTKG